MLTKAQANKVAQMAHDGLARSIEPVHTMGDGDVVFALATGASGPRRRRRSSARWRPTCSPTRSSRAVRAARGIGGAGLPDLPAVADLDAASLSSAS